MGISDRSLSLITAIAAVGIAVWQGYLTRKHNYLSSRPDLTGGGIALPDENIIFKKAVKNSGLGPAIIGSIDVYFNDEPVSDLTLEELLKRFVETYQLHGDFELAWFMLKGDQIMLSPNEEITVLELIESNNDYTRSELYGIASDFINDIRIDIHYSSIYKEQFNDILV